MSKALLNCVYRCHACRSRAVHSLFGLTNQASQSHARRQLYSHHAKGDKDNEHARPIETEWTPERHEEPSKESLIADFATTSHIPWYLQEDMQEVLPKQGPSRHQLLPVLPEHPPPILENVLRQLSDTLGIDDLTLFDLRELDPPPALGANLIMVIGTTRSTKHLNASADKLCRWLRREYKLRPDADGLLGRQELKLKLRRKARKAKLAASVGATIENADDGIVTGWICVNVGNVEDGRPAKELPKLPGFVGFGSQKPECQLVIQLMTSEKREQVDLETLWGGLLLQRGPTPQLTREQVVAELEASYEATRTNAPPPSPRVTVDSQQRRGFHTSSSRLSTTSEFLRPAPRPLRTYISEGQKSVSNKWNKPVIYAPPYQNHLIQRIIQAPREHAIEHLGEGPNDRSSTKFLTEFYNETSHYDIPYREALRFELIRLGVEKQHPNYTKRDLYNAFQDLSLTGYRLSTIHVHRTLDAFLVYQRPPDGVFDPTNPAHLRLPDADLSLALDFLRHLSIQSKNLFGSPILGRLHRGAGYQLPVYVVPQQSVPASFIAEKAYPVSRDDYSMVMRRQKRMLKIMKLGFARFIPEQFMELLRQHLYQEEYEEFWELWRRSVLVGVERSKMTYVKLFEMLAERGNERLVRQMIDEVVPMMEREDPPLEFDEELRDALAKCLRVIAR